MDENNKKIKILWFVNAAFPAVEKYLGRDEYLGTGWWMKATVKQLCQRDDVEIAVAWASDEIYQYEKIQEGGMTYYLIPQHPVPDRQKHRILSRVMRYVNSIKAHKYTAELANCIRSINEFQPDLVHVWGTENFYGLVGNMVDVPVLIRFQGLLHVIQEDYWGDLGWKNRIKMPNEMLYYLNIRKRARAELSIIKINKYFEGESEWDLAHLREYNKSATYYDVPVMLRPGFYGNAWSINNKKQHTVYITARSQPLKGNACLIKAINIVKKYIPDIQLRIGGQISNSGYGAHLKQLIRKYHLEDNVIFLGPLKEEAIIKELLSAHVYVLSSYIENACHSFLEANLVGVPSVATFVGGAATLSEHNVTTLLTHKGDSAMMAANIMKIFNNDELAQHLSEGARKRFLKRLDSDRVINGMLTAYRGVIEEHNSNKVV